MQEQPNKNFIHFLMSHLLCKSVAHALSKSKTKNGIQVQFGINRSKVLELAYDQAVILYPKPSFEYKISQKDSLMWGSLTQKFQAKPQLESLRFNIKEK